MSEPPERIRRLSEQRAAARAQRDFALADALRAEIEGAGWRVVDGPDGFELLAMPEPEPEPRVRVEDVGSILEESSTHDATVHWLAEGWPRDVLRGIESFERHRRGRRLQHVVVETAGDDIEWPAGVEVIRLARDPGFASARNAGLRRTSGRIALIVDASIEATGDVLGPIERALADPSVGVVGPFGVTSRDLEAFEGADGPDVDAIEGYLMGLRRDLLHEVRFDRKFRFYRAADIDLSFQVKALGLRAVRIEVPVRRHAHRRWEATDPQERWRLSKRNYYRFLDRFRGRTDLLVTPPD